MSALYARINRHGTRVGCGHCGRAFATLERAGETFRSYLTEIGGKPSETDYVEVRAGELYVSPLTGFLRRSDGVYDVGPAALRQWRARGSPDEPRFARGDSRDPVAVLPSRFRCSRCREVSILDAGTLGVVQHLVTSPAGEH